MTTVTGRNTELRDIWKIIFNTYDNVELNNVSPASPNSSVEKGYSFSFTITTKKGKQNMATIRIWTIKGQLNLHFSDGYATKEMIDLLSALSDKVLENLEYLDPSFCILKTFGSVIMPFGYRIRGKEKKQTNSGVKKEEILGKEKEIIAFFNELKTKELPVRTIHQDERRIFRVGGRGSKYLVDFFLKLGIAKEIGKWDSYHTMRFESTHYKSPLYSVMDEWESFIQNKIGLKKCSVHTWYID